MRRCRWSHRHGARRRRRAPPCLTAWPFWGRAGRGRAHARQLHPHPQRVPAVPAARTWPSILCCCALQATEGVRLAALGVFDQQAQAFKLSQQMVGAQGGPVGRPDSRPDPPPPLPGTMRVHDNCSDSSLLGGRSRGLACVTQVAKSVGALPRGPGARLRHCSHPGQQLTTAVHPSAAVRPGAGGQVPSPGRHAVEPVKVTEHEGQQLFLRHQGARAPLRTKRSPAVAWPTTQNCFAPAPCSALDRPPPRASPPPSRPLRAATEPGGSGAGHQEPDADQRACRRLWRPENQCRAPAPLRAPCVPGPTRNLQGELLRFLGGQGSAPHAHHTGRALIATRHRH